MKIEHALRGKTITVFECDEYTDEMLKWLYSQGEAIQVTQPSFETLTIGTVGGRSLQTAGRRTPMVITINDEQIALLFRLKFTNILLSATTILIQQGTFK